MSAEEGPTRMSGTSEFLAALRYRESRNNYSAVNTLGFLGAYQFGEAALIDLGFVIRDDNYRDNVFNGGWTGKCGVTSREGFLASVAAQEQAVAEWLPLLWKYIQAQGLEPYAWTMCGGVGLTPSGMIAAAHLLGAGGLKSWIDSGGTLDLRDAYGTPLKEYILLFANYDLPYGPAGALPAEAPPPSDPGLIAGTEGADDLAGTSGDDRILGQGGDDRVAMDAGNDRIDGGEGRDWVTAEGSAGLVVDLALAGAQSTGYGTDTILNVENARGGAGADRLSGNAGANELWGGAGSDVLAGRGGSDRLVGGAGRDQMSGGVDGAEDVFVFLAASDSSVGRKRDVVSDFASGVDALDLSAIDPRAGVAGDQAFAYAGSTAAAYSVWAVAYRGDLLVRGDVNGDRTADFEIRLNDVTSINLGDLIL